jgi:ATP-dependent protease HslVU (ClpYQ) ATPase subunit
VVSPELRKRFILDEDAASERIERLVAELCEWCVVESKGRVIIKRDDLASRERVRLVLAARWLASQLDDTIQAEVSVAELEASTGLPRDQLRARLSELARSRFTTVASRGVYVAVPTQVEALARELNDRLQSR